MAVAAVPNFRYFSFPPLQKIINGPVINRGWNVYIAKEHLIIPGPLGELRGESVENIDMEFFGRFGFFRV